MKKIIILIIILAIAGGVVWRINNSVDIADLSAENSDEASVPTSETVKVSGNLSEYKNDELGFSVKYPTSWEKGESNTSIVFLVPTENLPEKNTIGNLEAKIDVISGKCSFPPVTTVNERDTLVVGDKTFNMVSIANTVQGRNYFNRMYTLQRDSVCYFFTFTSVLLSPTSKGFVGADAQKVGVENKKIIDTADNQFKDMVKSFKFVEGPEGKDEAKVAPKNNK